VNSEKLKTKAKKAGVIISDNFKIHYSLFTIHYSLFTIH